MYFSHHYYADSMLYNTSHVNYLGAIEFSSQLKDSLNMDESCNADINSRQKQLKRILKKK